MPEQHDEAVMPGTEADDDITVRERLHRNRRSLELCLFILILFGINFLWTAHTAQRVTDTGNQAIAKACDFWYPLTSIQPTTPPGATRPTKLSIEIIAGARESYAGQCSPPHPALPAPAPGLVKWAHFYHIPVI